MLRLNKKIVTVLGSMIAALAIIGIITVYLVIALNWNSYDKCDTGSLPYGIFTLQYNKTFTIYWPKPEEECTSSFFLKYTIEDQAPVEVHLSNTSWIVKEKLEPCDVVEAQLWAVTKEGETSKSFISNTFLVHPQTVTFINTTQSLNEDGSLMMTWENPSPSPKCNVYYTLSCLADTNWFRYETSSQSVLIRNDLFCFQVFILLDGWVGSLSFAIETENVVIPVPPVEDLSLTRLEVDIWHVSWTANSKQEQCNIEYEITFSDSVDESAVIIKDSNYTFVVGNCNFVSVTVKAVSGELIGEGMTVSQDC